MVLNSANCDKEKMEQRIEHPFQGAGGNIGIDS